MATPEELRQTFLFEACTDEQLGWVLGHAEEVRVPAGARLLTEGQPDEALFVLLDGEEEFFRTVGGRELPLSRTGVPGSWGGWLPMFEGGSPIGLRTLRPSRLLRIPKDAVRHMLQTGFPIATHLLNGLTWGVRNFEAVAQQGEKLAALGKLSAGLAHELNNPAAAARRAAARLAETLTTHGADGLLLGRRLDEGQARRLAGLRADALGRVASRPVLAPLDRADREDELADWLDDRGVPNGHGYELAPTLLDFGLGPEDLEGLADGLPEEVLADGLGWLAMSLAAVALVGDIERSAGRISELVGAIKGYTHMDRDAAVVATDVHQGLEETLKILAHKLRDVDLRRDFDRELPTVRANPGELNQVWTNLLDNALDAVGGRPAGERRIAIRTDEDHDGILVEVADNGPGIPADLRDRIFEPFFTTKPLGQGTGLGLDTSYRIVVGGHGGDLRLASAEPGETRFQVWLPFGGAGGGEG